MDILDEIKQGYERITGKPCSVDVFVVLKGQKFGYYTVHPQPSGDLYMVKVKRSNA